MEKKNIATRGQWPVFAITAHQAQTPWNQSVPARLRVGRQTPRASALSRWTPVRPQSPSIHFQLNHVLTERTAKTGKETAKEEKKMAKERKGTWKGGKRAATARKKVLEIRKRRTAKKRTTAEKQRIAETGAVAEARRNTNEAERKRKSPRKRNGPKVRFTSPRKRSESTAPPLPRTTPSRSLLKNPRNTTRILGKRAKPQGQGTFQRVTLWCPPRSTGSLQAARTDGSPLNTSPATMKSPPLLRTVTTTMDTTIRESLTKPTTPVGHARRLLFRSSATNVPRGVAAR